MKRVIDSNGNSNSKTRRSTKIVKFFIKNITSYSYFMHLITEIVKQIKSLFGLKQLKATKTMAIVTLTPNV